MPLRVVGGARKLGILPLFSGASSCFPRNVASSVLRKRSVNSGVLYVSRVALLPPPSSAHRPPGGGDHGIPAVRDLS
eukprot:scaffold2118_cov391-Prasinococcus_capsulatus_cf.AAC.5